MHVGGPACYGDQLELKECLVKELKPKSYAMQLLSSYIEVCILMW
jgi:hypothetical protein